MHRTITTVSWLRPLVVGAVLALGASALVSAQEPPAKAPAARPAGATVDINTASIEEFDALPGIGPALAQRIVEYRRQNGPFQKVDDLLAVKGVGPKMLAKIRDRLAASQPKAAARPASS